MSKDELLTITVEYTEYEIRRGCVEIKQSDLEKLIKEKDKSSLIDLVQENSDFWVNGIDDDAPVRIYYDESDETVELPQELKAYMAYFLLFSQAKKSVIVVPMLYPKTRSPHNLLIMKASFC